MSKNQLVANCDGLPEPKALKACGMQPVGTILHVRFPGEVTGYGTVSGKLFYQIATEDATYDIFPEQTRPAEDRKAEDWCNDDFAKVWNTAQSQIVELTAERDYRQAQLDRLTSDVQKVIDGDYPSAPRNEKCSHGIYSWECCGNCIDEALTAALRVAEGEG